MSRLSWTWCVVVSTCPVDRAHDAPRGALPLPESALKSERLFVLNRPFEPRIRTIAESTPVPFRFTGPSRPDTHPQAPDAGVRRDAGEASVGARTNRRVYSAQDASSPRPRPSWSAP